MSVSARLKNKKRLIILFTIFALVLIALGARLGWIMLVQGDEYSKKAASQQIRDNSIAAERGTIYDSNMNELAINAPSYSLWAFPETLKASGSKPSQLARKIALIVDQEEKVVFADITKDASMVRVAKNLNADQRKAIQALIKEENITGLSIDEASKRHYPYGELASNLIGHTNDDGNGICGLELFYNSYLSGTAGRLIQNADVNGRVLSYKTEKYYEPEDGLNLVLTIDSVLQQYLENQLKSAYNDMGAKQTFGISINPNTGEILAMGIYPGYDLNNPRTPVTEAQKEEYEALATSEERVKFWNQMWRNFIVSDTYEPGSTFKLITTAIALEEGLTNLNETFNCIGYYQLYDDQLNCWKYPGCHGVQTLAQAVQNSCNPVFVTLGLRIGAAKYYEYLEALGFTTKTGIDLPSETSAIMYDFNNIMPGELGALSYGQGISVTPIQLVSAIATIVNGGNLITPHVVRQIQDDEGNIIFAADNKVKRKIFSEQTSKEMCEIMQSVVDEGTGKAGYIAGYRVGGKTGTADKVVNGRYAAGKVYSSFVSVAPSDDPEVVTLIVVDEPAGSVHYASTVVVPYVKSYLEEALPYIQVEPVFDDQTDYNTSAGSISVPNFCGKTVEASVAKLGEMGLKAIVRPTSQDKTKKVVDQYPKYLGRVNPGSTVYLYTE